MYGEICSENLEGTGHLVHLGICVRIMLKSILQKWYVMV
jgi:hypothetical protein